MASQKIENVFLPPSGSACRGAILQAVHLSTPCHGELVSHAALVICVKRSVKDSHAVQTRARLHGVDSVKYSMVATCPISGVMTAGECTRPLAGRLRTARVAQ